MAEKKRQYILADEDEQVIVSLIQEGNYKSKLVSVAFMLDVKSRFGITDRIIYTFDIMTIDGIVRESFPMYYSSGPNSPAGRMAGDLAAVENIDPKNITCRDVKDKYYNLEIKHTKDTEQEFVVVDNVSPFTGDDDDISELDSQPAYRESAVNKYLPNRTLLKPVIFLPEGKYAAMIDNVELKKATNGKNYLKTRFKAKTATSYQIVPVSLFAGKHTEVLDTLDGMITDGTMDSLIGQKVSIDISVNGSYYDISCLEPLTDDDPSLDPQHRSRPARKPLSFNIDEEDED